MSYWYIATPFTKYPHGHEAAYLKACEETTRLALLGIPVLSPIVHGWGMAKYGNAPMVDATFWAQVNLPLMEAARGCIVVQMEGWTQSDGVRDEIDYFYAAKREVVFCRVGAVPLLSR